MDRLSVRALQVRCIVGVHAHERKREQDLLVDADLWFDFSTAAASDRLDDTVDYTRVTEDLAAFVRAERFRLIETLARRACDRILAQEPRLRRCRLTIRKPAALPEAECAAVTVDRERPA